MISHSPPIFSHSPPVSFLTDYMNNHRQHAPFRDDHNRSSLYCRPQMMTLASKVIVNNASATVARSGRYCLDRMTSAPVLTVQPKSCLSRRSSQTFSKHPAVNFPTTLPTNSARSDQSKARKKVIFADDEGLSLTEVRVMSEPSNVPPYWSMKFLEQITQGLVSPHPADQWTVDFKQPASDYLSFRRKIERDFVSLENVIVKDDESIIVGTVKVKNVDFAKEVFVRVTWDDWKSQQDMFCNYARAYGPATNAHVVFDTFSFKITLPPSSKRLEFCICFRVNTQEYWDNNDNKNYTISKRSPFYFNALSPYDKNSSRNSCQAVKMSTLSEALASTQDNITAEPSPYW